MSLFDDPRKVRNYKRAGIGLFAHPKPGATDDDLAKDAPDLMELLR